MTDPTIQTEHRFNHLIASAGQKRRAWSSNTAVVSLVIHSALIAGVAYATVRAPEQAAIVPDVTYVELQPEKKIEEEKPEPAAPEEEPAPVAVTQAITPPEETPLEIPDVDLSQSPVSAADHSGEGVVGDVVEGVPTEDVAPNAEIFAYTLAELDDIPRLRNGAQMTRVFERLYPRLLQDAGIGGTVMLEFVIEADGLIDMESVKVLDSSHDQLSSATIDAIESFRFNPGRYRGEPVRVLIQMPITWKAPD